MNFSNIALLTTTLCTLCPTTQAASITVDGNLADWGLHRNGNINDWTPDPLLVGPNQYAVEDQTNGARLFPGWGGQAYDAEALYTSMDNNFLYIALVTGLSPLTPNDPTHNSFGPGDFAIDFGQDGSFEFGIETTGANAGKVYRDVAWNYGIWDVNGDYINDSHNAPDPAHPTSMVQGSGTNVGLGQLIYTTTYFTNMGQYVADKHYVIEAAIPLVAFNGFSDKFDIHWTMNCANDAIWADPILPNHVPEPTIIALFLIGISGLMFLSNGKRAMALAA